MLENITLPNGKIITWDEFCNLPEDQQQDITRQLGHHSDKYWSVDGEGSDLPSRKELLPRIRAAAERNAFKEEDLLAFIKVVHDIFFPPQPMRELKPNEVLPGKTKRGYVNSPFTQMSKAVITPAGEFPSMASAGRYYQVEGSRIRAWVKANKPGFKYKKCI